MKDFKLDDEEQELLDSIESGEWQSVANVAEAIKEHQNIAKTTAVELGLPYQTSVCNREIGSKS